MLYAEHNMVMTHMRLGMATVIKLSKSEVSVCIDYQALFQGYETFNNINTRLMTCVLSLIGLTRKKPNYKIWLNLPVQAKLASVELIMLF